MPDAWLQPSEGLTKLQKVSQWWACSSDRLCSFFDLCFELGH